MPRPRSTHTAEFKLQAVQLVTEQKLAAARARGSWLTRTARASTPATATSGCWRPPTATVPAWSTSYDSITPLPAPPTTGAAPAAYETESRTSACIVATPAASATRPSSRTWCGSSSSGASAITTRSQVQAATRSWQPRSGPSLPTPRGHDRGDASTGWDALVLRRCHLQAVPACVAGNPMTRE